MPTVEVFDHEQNGPLSFDLIDILDVLEPFSADVDWYLIEFDPVFLLGEGETKDLPAPDWVRAIWQNITNGIGPIKVSWETVKAFAKFVGQTEDMVMIGEKIGDHSPTEPLDLNNKKFVVVVQAVDPSFWAITSQNEKLIESFRKHFRDTRLSRRQADIIRSARRITSDLFVCEFFQLKLQKRCFFAQPGS